MAKVEVLNRLFPPIIGVAASAKADQLCLPLAAHFADLLQPFSQMSTAVSLRDMSGLTYSLSNYRVKFVPISELDNSATAASIPELVSATASLAKPNDIVSREDVLRYLEDENDQSMPWYNVYRDTTLRTMGLSDHDFTGHPVACLVVVSSTDTSPLEMALQLYQNQSPPPPFDRPYVDGNILRFYILVHDISLGQNEEMETLFRRMKATFGMHSHFLRLNTKAQPRTVMHGVWKDHPESCQLWSGDADALAQFVRDLVTQSILPNLTRTIGQINETVAASRRGLTGRLLSAGKKYFGSPSTTATVITPPTPGSRGQSTLATTGVIPLGSVYSLASPESQLRRLADLALLLQDVRFAQSIYDTVKKDFQHDKAFKYFAGVQEMLGVCSMITETVREADVLFDSAISYYAIKCKLPSWGTRTVLIANELYKLRGAYKEIPLLLLRMTVEDDDLRSALLLEQAAHSYLRVSPPLVRKYAFHLILAGHRFNKCGQTTVTMSSSTSSLSGNAIGASGTVATREHTQREHAYRCYHAALRTYANKNWALVEEHIHFTLARQAFHLGRTAQALLFFVRLLGATSLQPAIQQRSYLREFIYIYQHFGGQQQRKSSDMLIEDHVEPVLVPGSKPASWAEVGAPTLSGPESLSTDSEGNVWLSLGVPRLNRRNLRIVLNAGDGPGSIPPVLLSSGILVAAPLIPAKSNVNNAVLGSSNDDNTTWSRMAELLVSPSAHNSSSSSNNHSSSSSESENVSTGRPLCVLGEQLSVLVELSNPLQVPLILQQVQLQCSYVPHQVIVTRDPLSDREIVSIREQSSNSVPKTTTAAFSVDSQEQVVISAGEVAQIVFKLVPKREGTINLLGLTYLLSGVIRGRQPFSFKNSVDPSLSLIVTEPMPLLAITLDPPMPPQLLSGEVFQGTITLTNQGQAPLADARLVLSHPTMVHIASTGNFDRDSVTPVPLTDGLSSASVIDTPNRLWDPAVVPLPLNGSAEVKTDAVLAPGASVSMPIWFRGERVGSTSVFFLFSYRSKTARRVLSERIVRQVVPVTVVPSLRLAHFTRPSAQAHDDTLVGIEAENLSSSFSIRLDQLTSVSPLWRITHTDTTGSTTNISGSDPYVLPPLSSAFLFFRIVRSKTPVVSTETTADQSEAKSTTDRLCPEIAFSRVLWHAFVGAEVGQVRGLPPISLVYTNLLLNASRAPHISTSLPLLSMLKRARARWRLRRLTSAFPDMLKMIIPASSIIITDEERQDEAKSTSSFDSSPGELLRSFLPVFTTDELDLTVFWSTIPAPAVPAGPSTVASLWLGRKGHHHVLGLPCGPQEPILLPLRAGTSAEYGGDMNGKPLPPSIASWTGATFPPKQLQRLVKETRRGAQLQAASTRSLTSFLSASVPGTAATGTAALIDAHVADEALLRFRLISPDTVTHDFSANSLCTVKVELVLYNSSMSAPLAFLVQLGMIHSASQASNGASGGSGTLDRSASVSSSSSSSAAPQNPSVPAPTPTNSANAATLATVQPITMPQVASSMFSASPKSPSVSNYTNPGLTTSSAAAAAANATNTLKPPSPVPFTWLGPSQISGTLTPRAEKRITLQLLLPAPAVVDLASGCQVFAGPLGGSASMLLSSGGNVSTSADHTSLTLVTPTSAQHLLRIVG